MAGRNANTDQYQNMGASLQGSRLETGRPVSDLVNLTNSYLGKRFPKWKDLYDIIPDIIVYYDKSDNKLKFTLEYQSFCVFRKVDAELTDTICLYLKKKQPSLLEKEGSNSTTSAVEEIMQVEDSNLQPTPSKRPAPWAEGQSTSFTEVVKKVKGPAKVDWLKEDSDEEDVNEKHLASESLAKLEKGLSGIDLEGRLHLPSNIVDLLGNSVRGLMSSLNKLKIDYYLSEKIPLNEFTHGEIFRDANIPAFIQLKANNKQAYDGLLSLVHLLEDSLTLKPFREDELKSLGRSYVRNRILYAFDRRSEHRFNPEFSKYKSERERLRSLLSTILPRDVGSNLIIAVERVIDNAALNVTLSEDLLDVLDTYALPLSTIVEKSYHKEKVQRPKKEALDRKKKNPSYQLKDSDYLEVYCQRKVDISKNFPMSTLERSRLSAVNSNLQQISKLIPEELAFHKCLARKASIARDYIRLVKAEVDKISAYLQKRKTDIYNILKVRYPQDNVNTKAVFTTQQWETIIAEYITPQEEKKFEAEFARFGDIGNPELFVRSLVREALSHFG